MRDAGEILRAARYMRQMAAWGAEHDPSPPRMRGWECMARCAEILEWAAGAENSVAELLAEAERTGARTAKGAGTDA